MEKKKEKIMNLNAKKIVLIVLFALVCGGFGFALAQLTGNKECNEFEQSFDNQHSLYNHFYSEMEHININDDINGDGEDYYATLSIAVNNKNVPIHYKESYENGYSLSVGNNTILEGSKFIGPDGSFSYKIIKARDNKEYLLLTYYFMTSYYFIIDENAQIIKQIFNYDDNKCMVWLDDEKEPMFYIEDGYIYYYRYKNKIETEDEFGNSILLELIKVDINNSTITETKTGIEKNGGFGQCD